MGEQQQPAVETAHGLWLLPLPSCETAPRSGGSFLSRSWGWLVSRTGRRRLGRRGRRARAGRVVVGLRDVAHQHLRARRRAHRSPESSHGISPSDPVRPLVSALHRMAESRTNHRSDYDILIL